MLKRSQILNLAQGAAKTVSQEAIFDFKVTLDQILSKQISFINSNVFSVAASGRIGIDSVVQVTNDRSGFIWGIHTWGIHSISNTPYTKVADIPIESIGSIL